MIKMGKSIIEKLVKRALVNLECPENYEGTLCGVENELLGDIQISFNTKGATLNYNVGTIFNLDIIETCLLNDSLFCAYRLWESGKDDVTINVEYKILNPLEHEEDYAELDLLKLEVKYVGFEFI
jgi:hypothetical protein